MKISLRLKTLGDLVEPTFYLADVGSDHALLPLYLFSQEKIQKAQLIENKIGPYKRMEKAVSLSPYHSQCLLTLSDGLSELDKDVSAIVVAGMGGQLISSILRRDEEKLKSIDDLYIDAHSERSELLMSLGKLSYSLVDSIFLEDEHKFYDLWHLKRTKNKVLYNEKEALFGPLHLKNKEASWAKYWEAQKKEKETILLNKEVPTFKRSILEKEISMIEEALR